MIALGDVFHLTEGENPRLQHAIWGYKYPLEVYFFQHDVISGKDFSF